MDHVIICQDVEAWLVLAQVVAQTPEIALSFFLAFAVPVISTLI